MKTSSKESLIILDRDGVLNDVVIDPEHGTIDSPLHPSQVKVFSWVPEALGRLTEAGFTLVVATNQPAWAKGKTTEKNLRDAHDEVLRIAQSQGGKISKSYICFHRSEDQCDCRKPKPGMLRQALEDFSQFQAKQSWMVGDGITDIQAGKVLSLRTAFLAPQKCDACKVVRDRNLEPDLWVKHLLDFTNAIIQLP